MSYSAGLKHVINCVKHAAELGLGLIELSEFRKLTSFYFSDFLHSKNNVFNPLSRKPSTAT
jgi:hypothetical protein